MKRILLLFIIFLFPLHIGFSEDLSEYYARLWDLFDYFSDPNTGTTAFPVLRVPSGGLYEGMGTAYTAVALDSSFLDSNPSGSALLDATELSLLQNNWIADSRVEGVIYTMRFNDLGIGIGGKFLYLPFKEYDSFGEGIAGSYYSEMVGTLNIAYNFFSSYYFYGLAAGINLKAAYRHVADIHVPDELGSQKALMAMADIGLLTRFNFLKFYASRDKNFSVGSVVKNLGPPVSGDPLPSEATLGIAYSPIRPVTLAVDFNIPFSLDPDVEPESWNIASGFNVVFADFFSIHGGFSYRGANPRATIGSIVKLTDMSLIMNYTVDMSTRFDGDFNRFSLEAKLNLGDEGRYSIKARVDELYIAGLEAYAKGNLEEAIAFWEAALTIDPQFQPAQENLATAKKSLELLDRMEALQKTE